MAKISITARQRLAGNPTINGQNSSTANVADVDDTVVHPLKPQSLGFSLSLSKSSLSEGVSLSLKSLYHRFFHSHIVEWRILWRRNKKQSLCFAHIKIWVSLKVIEKRKEKRENYELEFLGRSLKSRACLGCEGFF